MPTHFMPSRSRLSVALIASLLSACGTPKPPPPSSAPKPTPFAAILQPGCLLPRPDLLSKSASPRADLVLQVDASGRVASASLQASTGSSELDDALKTSVSQCRFTPAYIVEAPKYARVDVPETYVLNATWSSTGPFLGPHRCFMPDYPHAARRNGEAGRVKVNFRKSSVSGDVEVHANPESASMRILQALSVRAVRECVAHEEVKAALPADTWISMDYQWRLE
jgi:TonB family protein